MQGQGRAKHTSKFLVIIVRVHSNTASKTRGTSPWIFSRSLLMMAANKLSTSASLLKGDRSSLSTDRMSYKGPYNPGLPTTRNKGGTEPLHGKSKAHLNPKYIALRHF